ncbi:TRAP transporter substrate-binding protein DctP [Pseudorhodoferax sp.]|uniref:TRAP transporter substrate-binding protein DctP n=1 Tax=Pseudorhodoferax sp. TaxID=1993553 RepID=UPI002DD65562|nr:TRAP transporter substrate-binding protein DctP [Pseudorhodoferax sp.]
MHSPLRRLALTAAATLVLTAPAAFAQQVTLRAVNAFQEGTTYARNFERFVKKVNDEGKGLVQINYLGGPKAIPTMEQGAALRNGVVDLANTTTSFVASTSPESLSVNYATISWAEMRRTGVVDELNKLMMEKGLYYFARTGDGVPYHIYLNKKIDKADLTGLKIRIAPIYREFFSRLGAQVMQVAPGEVFTALERGVVDGYGWPLLGIFDLGWHEKTKFRVDPGFYNIELGVIFSAKTWNTLNAAQKEFLNKQAAWLEGLNVDMAAKDAPAELKRQADAGIQVIKLPEAEAAKLLKLSLDAGWAGVIAASPQHGPRLRQLMAP